MRRVFQLLALLLTALLAGAAEPASAGARSPAASPQERQVR